MAHGTAAEMDRAKAGLEPLAPRRITVYDGDRLPDEARQQLDGELPLPASKQGALVEAVA